MNRVARILRLHYADTVAGFELGLRVQMGVAFTEQTIRTFMGLFTRAQLKETISQESTAGYKVRGAGAPAIHTP